MAYYNLFFFLRENFWNNLFANITLMKEEKYSNDTIGLSKKEDDDEVAFQEYIKSASFVFKIISIELFNNIIE